MKRGFSLVEMMAASIAIMVVLAGLFQVIISTMSSYRYTMGSSASIVDAGELVNQIAAEVRRASICDLRKGCADSPGSAVYSADTNQITLFNSSTGKKISIQSNGGDVLLTKDGSSSVMADDANINLRYYLASDYNSGELLESKPSPIEFKNIIAVEITATVLREGVTDSYTATVRLRNGPNKTSASL